MRGRVAQPPNSRQVAFRIPSDVDAAIDRVKQVTGAATTSEVVVALLRKALDMKTVREMLDRR